MRRRSRRRPSSPRRRPAERPLLLASAAANDNDNDLGAPRKPHAVRLTPEHPVYVADRNGEELGWTMAGELAPGDRIADIDGRALVKVVSNTLEAAGETFYNFEVDGAHTYFADELGLWAHNPIIPLGGGNLRSTTSMTPPRVGKFVFIPSGPRVTGCEIGVAPPLPRIRRPELLESIGELLGALFGG